LQVNKLNKAIRYLQIVARILVTSLTKKQDRVISDHMGGQNTNRSR